jgi:hypothetical protein
MRNTLARRGSTVEQRYWLATFDRRSWRTFLELNPSTLGSKTERPDISVGDVFINYVRTEGPVLGQWVSAEQIVGNVQFEDRRIYQDGVWPYRWQVEPITPRFIADDGIVAKELIGQMQMFSGCTPQNWGSPLRSQGREIPKSDGQLLVQLLSSSTCSAAIPNVIPPRRASTRSTAPRPTRREIPLALRYKVLKRDDFRCVKCGRSPAMSPGLELHVDHVVPWASGGETVIENLQCLCAECNLGKSNRHSG